MSGFTFNPLNKLYAFILKKTIGKFLHKDNDLDRALDVSLAQGTVNLSNLKLDQQVFLFLFYFYLFYLGDIRRSIICLRFNMFLLNLLKGVSRT
jgi:hypothetical protein